MAIQRGAQRHRHYARFQQGLKIAHCPICGKPRDVYHRGLQCVEAWLKKLDEEGNPSNTRRKP